jgi:ketosteroid isomerase-like protein
MSEEGRHHEAVRAKHDDSIQAVLNHEVEAIESHFSEAFHTTGGDFQFKSRDEIARGVESGKLKYKNIENHVEDVKFAGEHVALVTGQRTVEAEINGEAFQSKFENTAVYAREGDEWKVVLWAVGGC